MVLVLNLASFIDPSDSLRFQTKLICISVEKSFVRIRWRKELSNFTSYVRVLKLLNLPPSGNTERMHVEENWQKNMYRCTAVIGYEQIITF